MLVEHGREGFELGAVGCVPDTRHLGWVDLQGGPEVEVARVVYQYCIAGTEQQPTD